MKSFMTQGFKRSLRDWESTTGVINWTTTAIPQIRMFLTKTWSMIRAMTDDHMRRTKRGSVKRKKNSMKAGTKVIPSGGYKITHGNNTLGGNRHVHIRAVHAYLADSEPTEAGLQHLETVYSDQISMASAAGAYHFHTNKSARVYFWVSPCDGTKENPRSKIEVTLSSSETRYKL
jgi:hypothetical protein